MGVLPTPAFMRTPKLPIEGENVTHVCECATFKYLTAIQNSLHPPLSENLDATACVMLCNGLTSICSEVLRSSAL